MALILSAATGNFNAGATWVGGIVPGAADEARASTTHTITITANVSCTELSNDGTGIFTLNSGVTLTANVTAKSTTATRNCLQFTAASPSTAMIVGTCTGGTVSSAQAVVNTSTGSLAITGNVSAGAGISSVGVQNASTGTVTITGNITGGAGSGAFGVNNSTTGIVTITGNATGGTGSTAYGVNNLTTGTVTITGIATGGSTNGAEGARNIVGGVLSVGRANGNAFGIGSTGIVAGFGVTSGQTSVTKVKEIEYGSRGMSPTSGPIYLDSDLTNVAILVNYPIGTGSKTLSDPNNTAGLSPAATDVRNGVVYNYGVNTGSAYIPSAGSVAFGVPVDATTGTATLTAANVRTALGLASANLDTQLAVLSNLDAAVSSRLAPNGTLATVTTLTNAPASVTPSDIWSHAARTLTSASGPSATDIRQELDSNSTKLANLDATVSSRLASSAYSAAPTTAQIATAVEGSLLNEADGQAVLNAIVGAIGNTNLSEVSLVAAFRADLERVGGKIDSIPAAPTAAANATAVWSAATKTITGGTVDTLTNSPSVPSAASIASATRTELTTELGRLDAAVSTRLATSAYTAPSTAPTAAANASAVRTELTTELAKVAALNTDRLANVATTAIVGNLIAQANS